ncbi:GntR family transcriptional regulator [Ferrimicrobium sp.]|uniref:GntR family transcriptional regulator n=1 Tax=Ferrimicrobium sp. TaxID=2926050 RepID=UPI00261843C7|nr:GntR family transcriptional regulator [Ferrimicrobium sp.]
MEERPVYPAGIVFLVDRSTGVPAYRQIVNQVLAALRLGRLVIGDRLPPVTEVVRQTSINVNTALKAYKTLEAQGITLAKQGVGTLIVHNPFLGKETVHLELVQRLDAVIAQAIRDGLTNDDIRLTLATALERLTTTEEKTVAQQ